MTIRSFVTAVMMLLFAGGNARADPAAEKLFATHCASCHGKDGSGQVPAGKALHVSDWTKGEKVKAMSDTQIEEAIASGIKKDGKVRMPGFPNLSADEKKALMAHVRSLQK